MEKNKMKQLMFLTIVFGLMIAFTADVSAQVQDVGNGRVMLIYNASEFFPDAGDVVITRISEGNGDYGMKKGVKYTSLELRQGNKAMYISYSVKTSAIRELINNKNTTVELRGSNFKPWKTGDEITIRTKPASGGRTEVTFVSVNGWILFTVK